MEEGLDFVVFVVQLKLLLTHVGVSATEFLIPLISVLLLLSDLANFFGELFLVVTKRFLFVGQHVFVVMFVTMVVIGAVMVVSRFLDVLNDLMGIVVHDWLLNVVLKAIFLILVVLLGVAAGHLVLILALLVLEVALVFVRCELTVAYVQVKVLIIIVMVMFVMPVLFLSVGGLTVGFPELVGAFVLQILLVIAVMVIIIVSALMVVHNLLNYGLFMLTDDLVDRLADVVHLLFR